MSITRSADFHPGTIATILRGRLLAPTAANTVRALLEFLKDRAQVTQQIPRLIERDKHTLSAQSPEMM